MKLTGKWVLITGASSGFGAAAAAAFAREGAHVIIGARRMDKLNETATAARNQGAASVAAHPLDVASTPSVEAFVQWIRQLTPRIDILINNAGGALGLDPVVSGKDADWEGMVQSNFLGLLRMSRAVIPLLPHHDGAWILNVGSVAGHGVYEGGAAYCGVKAGERSVTQALRLELNGTGIRVGSLDPGLAETEFSLTRFAGDTARAAKILETLNSDVTLSAAVRERATDLAKFYTGGGTSPAIVAPASVAPAPVAPAAAPPSAVPAAPAAAAPAPAAPANR